MARINKTTGSKCWRGLGEGDPLLTVGIPHWAATMEIGLENPHKVKYNSTVLSSFSLFGMCPKYLVSYSIDIYSAMFTAALFIKARKWKQPKCPSVLS